MTFQNIASVASSDGTYGIITLPAGAVVTGIYAFGAANASRPATTNESVQLFPSSGGWLPFVIASGNTVQLPDLSSIPVYPTVPIAGGDYTFFACAGGSYAFSLAGLGSFTYSSFFVHYFIA